MSIDLYFSEYFRVDRKLLDDYGAFDISVVSDLPLFVDPFLLFNSKNPTYQRLHKKILKYLRFLRDRAAEEDLDPDLIDAWYRFKEVEQNWFGYTLFGNKGSGLGEQFADALHGALGDILQNFGNETVTRGTHLEKLCLIRSGVGKDNISDFATNLIKDFLCTYTQTFAEEHMDSQSCELFSVPRARFDYKTRTWASEQYYLPRLRNEFVLLTPADMLTRDRTWINHRDMITRFWQLPEAVSNSEQRAQINQYLRRALGEKPSSKRKREAAEETIRRFPELIDLYIKLQEDEGHRAEAISTDKVEDTRRVLVEEIQLALADLSTNTDFYDKPWTSYKECLERVRYFKKYIEDKDGYKLLNRRGEGFSMRKRFSSHSGSCGVARSLTSIASQTMDGDPWTSRLASVPGISPS
jgi:hypothetical protein